MAKRATAKTLAAAMPAAYTPPAGAVVHSVVLQLDARNKTVPHIVHLVQYDSTLPIIKADLVAGDGPYTVPEGGAVRIRLAKPDGNHVYNDALGLSEDRATAYISVTEQMTAADGHADGILEITDAEGIVGTARMTLVIDKNTVPQKDIESSGEYKSLEAAVADARGSADRAAQSAAAAEASASTADAKLQGTVQAAEQADASAQAAAGSAAAAQKSQEDAQQSQEAASGSASDAAGSAALALASETAAAKSEQAAEDWSNLSKSYAVGEGAPVQHPNEATDNAKKYAEDAANSAKDAADSVEVIKANQEGIQTIVINLAAILAAADNALAAQASAEDAATSAEAAKEAADRAQSISQGALGYYATAETLRTDHESGENGQWAIVGETDTIWVWDGDSGTWTDSGNKTDLSQYYTKDQTDQQLAELQQAMNKALTDALAEQTGQVDAKLAEMQTTVTAAQQAAATAQAKAEAATSRKWTLALTSSGWQRDETGVEWQGDTLHQYQDVTCEGMTADTLIDAITFVSGDLESASTWDAMQPDDGKVRLWAAENPAKDFTLRITEVH